MDDRSLETTHDFIQWMFPLFTTSKFNPHAPVLDEDDREIFRARADLRANLRKSLDRMLAFYGLPFSEGLSVIDASPCMNGIASRWLTPGNHNLLRMSRILSSSHTLDLEDESKALASALISIAPVFSRSITRETLRFWKEAARLPH